jgi:hypothetical protein
MRWPKAASFRDNTLRSEAEKKGTVDGINLFFGALLGANLGTLQGMPNLDYLILILMLSSTVIGLRVFSSSEHRSHTLKSLIGGLAILAVFLYLSADGLDPAARAKLSLTIGVWVASVVGTELWPVRPAPIEPKPHV